MMFFIRKYSKNKRFFIKNLKNPIFDVHYVNILSAKI